MSALIFLVIGTSEGNLFSFLSQLAYNSGILSKFAEHFPSDSAARSVPSVPSVACSTAEALAWDEAFKNMNEPSGRAVKDVHEDVE